MLLNVVHEAINLHDSQPQLPVDYAQNSIFDAYVFDISSTYDEVNVTT